MIAPAFISDRLTGPQMAAGRTSRRLGSGAVERRTGDMPAAVSWTPARAAAGTIAGAGGSLPSVLPTNRAGPSPRAIAEQVSRAAGVIGADISAGSARPGCWTASAASVKVPAGGGRAGERVRAGDGTVLASWSSGSQSSTLSNHRSPATDR